MPPEGVTVDVQPVRNVAPDSQSPQGDNRRIYALVCYYYPQYTLKQVEKMAYRDVHLLISTATRVEAERMYNLTMIASAPHSDKGKGVKTLMNHFKEMIEKN